MSDNMKLALVTLLTLLAVVTTVYVHSCREQEAKEFQQYEECQRTPGCIWQ